MDWRWLGAELGEEGTGDARLQIHVGEDSATEMEKG